MVGVIGVMVISGGRGWVECGGGGLGGVIGDLGVRWVGTCGGSNRSLTSLLLIRYI